MKIAIDTTKVESGKVRDVAKAFHQAGWRMDTELSDEDAGQVVLFSDPFDAGKLQGIHNLAAQYGFTITEIVEGHADPLSRQSPPDQGSER